ncbi:DUF262 domain-containing protein [Anaeroselena agilis]|uniref:DUF262 domain-containing protein n=1 Tax=Anaeroselena agilis TaxID=3063788 RepID=A0ABU3P4I0_9FIRM|nr:DUF262 domain-containing protein [Selenomonadales bacterium 4137-cl]
MEINERISQYRQDIKSDRVDMSFGEIINMYKDDEIIISPEYQRAFRWDLQRQTDFIESILLGIPFPSIFVATNADGTWELIDGLQRISTVLSFFGELKNPEKNHLTLRSGSIVPELEDITIDTLPLDLKLAIKRTPCRVEIIQKDSHFEMRYELFKRLNTGGEGLTRQEIRNCIFRGFENYRYFSDIITACSSNEDFREIVNISSEIQEKMMYEELFLRFFSLHAFRVSYTEKVIQDFFDKIMKKQCETPDKEIIARAAQIFTEICSYLRPLGYEIFKLARLNFSTSMFDAILLSLSTTTKDYKSIAQDTFKARVDLLREDDAFKRNAGAASSNASAINNKLIIARRILLDDTE